MKHNQRSKRIPARAFIYMRARCDTKVETAVAVRAQRAACIDAAKRLRATVTGRFVDRGHSANDRNRPGLAALRARLVSDPGITHVVIARHDRLARNAQFDTELIDEFMGRGVIIVAADELDAEGLAPSFLQSMRVVRRKLANEHRSGEARVANRKRAA